MKMRRLFASVLATSVLLSGMSVSAAPNQTEEKSISVFEQASSEYIVGYKGESAGIEAAIQKLGGKITTEWDFINSLVVELNPDKARMLELIPGVIFVSKSGEVVETGKGNTSSSVPDAKLIANAYNSAVGADKVWVKGITGQDVTVAVVDSGVIDNITGSDFKGRVVTNVKFAKTKYMADGFGHGTHVASILGGDGSQSNGKYPGIAPGVNLINVKISDDEGITGEKNLVNGLQWIYENHQKYNIKVVNISNQITAQQNYQESATNAAVELLWKAGVVVVVSAGNQGGEACSVCYAPANDPYVITVGAVDDNGTKDINDDSLKEWSSNGITLDGHSKPEVVAPGSEIIAYMPRGLLRDLRPSNILDEQYFKMGGTSMSAPVVSGIVALMLQVNPDMTPDQVKWVLKNTTRDYKLKPAGTGGIVTADAAVFYNLNNIPADVAQNYPVAHLLEPIAYDENGEFNHNISWSNISWSNISWSNIAWRNIAWRNNFDY